jgi:hypothetical protein
MAGRFLEKRGKEVPGKCRDKFTLPEGYKIPPAPVTCTCNLKIKKIKK